MVVGGAFLGFLRWWALAREVEASCVSNWYGLIEFGSFWLRNEIGIVVIGDEEIEERNVERRSKKR